MSFQPKQLEYICLEDLIPQNHIYREFQSLWDLETIRPELEKIEQNSDHKGYGVFRMFLCLLLQFVEDLSDRELEKFLMENNAAKWFCQFDLTARTPGHSTICRTREKIGTSRLSKIFNQLRDQLKQQGFISEVFTFIDATHLISKATLWKERDEAIEKKIKAEKALKKSAEKSAEGLEKLNKRTSTEIIIAEKLAVLNNENIADFAADKEARFGAKSKKKFWFGYKKHVSVDMQSGLINKVAITSAEVIDSKGFKNVTPKQGAVYADKAYCDKNVQTVAKANNLHLCAIKKNNMKGKNHDLDRFYSGIRAPYERVFAHCHKRTRYRGLVKNQFHAFMQTIAFNLKRLVVLTAENSGLMVNQPTNSLILAT